MSASMGLFIWRNNVWFSVFCYHERASQHALQVKHRARGSCKRRTRATGWHALRREGLHIFTDDPTSARDLVTSRNFALNSFHFSFTRPLLQESKNLFGDKLSGEACRVLQDEEEAEEYLLNSSNNNCSNKR